MLKAPTACGNKKEGLHQTAEEMPCVRVCVCVWCVGCVVCGVCVVCVCGVCLVCVVCVCVCVRARARAIVKPR